MYTYSQGLRSLGGRVNHGEPVRRWASVKGVDMFQSAANSGGYAALDVTRLRETSGGDREFEVELLRIFLEDCTRRLAILADALQSGDHKSVVREAHTIKGAALNVGTVHLHTLARTMEALRPSADPVDAQAHLHALQTEFELLRLEIARHLQS